jgi:hypothetical protein
MADPNSTPEQLSTPMRPIADADQVPQLGSLFVAIGRLTESAMEAAASNDGDCGGLSIVAQDLAELGSHLAQLWAERAEHQTIPVQ